MPGHYNYPTPPPPPKVSPRNKVAPSANEETKHNPFEGQYVIRGGKRVKRTPSTKPHRD